MSDNKWHKLLRDNPTVEQVQALIDKDPDAVKEKNTEGNLPLHHAAANGASLEVIQLLINEYPDGVKEKNSYGDLPLHLAVAASASLEVVQLLIKAYPNALKVKDKYGWLPLHLAASNDASVEVIQLLIKEYPDAVREKGPDGDLPLHWAVRYSASKEVLQLLIKEYPDAVREKDEDGNLPMDNPQIKEMYERAITGVQKLTRSQALRGDHAKGDDLLGVKEEAHAIADIIAFKDLQPPFVVGILGGWGSGKSFTFNLMKEHLEEIQKYNLAKEVIKLNSPYVGHIYLIRFDVWVFAKGCLWSSLMDSILTQLNDQLDLEAAIGPELLKEGVSVIKLMDEFTTIGDRKYLEEVLKRGNVKETLSEWKPSGGNITKALIEATNSNYEKEMNELAEKRRQLDNLTIEFEKQKIKRKQQLAWEDVTADFSTTFLPEIKKLLKDAYKQYAEEHTDEPVPETVDAAMNSMKQWKGIFGRLKRYWCLLRAGRLSPRWFAVFLSSLILAVTIPYFLGRSDAIVTAIGPLVSGMYAVYNDARTKLRSAQAEIAKVASEMHLDKEQIRKALKAADAAQHRSDKNDEEMQQDIIQKLNAEINSLEDRVWLRKGDSLKKVVADRVGSNNYEEHLGVVHQAQKDLQYISDAMLSSNQQGSFPRGDPRIVLFIDDLDRCTPKKVVETLEAVQLLVNTELFVVVLAIDAQYVTLCLEDEYPNVLSKERHPSGLDYIEKIVQLPYRVPPISDEYIESYLQAQMMAEDDDTRELSGQNISQVLQEQMHVEDDSREVSDGDEVRMTQDELSSAGSDESGSHDDNTNEGAPEETPTADTSQYDSKEPTVEIPTKELKFTLKELQSLKDACVLSGVGPRSGKRLVNVFKLMKIIWYYRDQTPDGDTPHEVNTKEASVLILAFCASNSRSVRREMCKVFARIEKTTSMPACGNLKDFIKKALGEIGSEQVDDNPLTMIYDEQCNRMFEKVKWEDDEEWKLVKNDLRLLRSFSFVGEYNEPHERKQRKHA